MVTISDFLPYNEELEQTYKTLHRCPEPGFREVKTSALVKSRLEEYGIECKQIALTGVIGTIYGGRPGKTVAIRADMDALPVTELTDLPYKSETDGMMHACGHDAHTAMLLAAAHYLQDHREQLKGNVRLIFQPAEEGSSPEDLKRAVAAGGSPRGGAASMIACGALEGVDACFALHVSGTPMASFGITIGNAAASSDEFHVTIKGRGGHGAQPDKAIEPLAALPAVLTAINQFRAREVDPLENCIITVGAVHSGTVWNVIPETVQIDAGYRTFSNELRDMIEKRLTELCEGICRGFRCECTAIRREGYAPTINDADIAREMLDVAARLFGDDNAVLNEKPLLGSEDCGYYFQEVPGAIGWLGVAPQGEEIPNNHNPKFRVPLQSLRYGAAFHINMVMDYLDTH